MSGGVSRLLFSIPRKRNRSNYPPVTTILSRILIRQTLVTAWLMWSDWKFQHQIGLSSVL